MNLEKASYWFVNVGEDGTGNRDWDDCTHLVACKLSDQKTLDFLLREFKP